MTKQEAAGKIEYIIDNGQDYGYWTDAQKKALYMAIKALEQESIIHCKECKHWHKWENGTGTCHISDIIWAGTDYDDYCSFAERKEQ